jgi:sensor histidine kinase regulating citrate/malate metabolism
MTSVADDGPGIPEETAETIRRGYETSMRHTDGPGLWPVQWVVDRSDAALGFESSDEGQVVRIRFDRVEETEGVAPRSAGERASRSADPPAADAADAAGTDD